jgi:GT2 family glycosyltransferase
VVVDGKGFRAGPAKFHLRGVTYGPFPPNGDGDLYPSPTQVGSDFDLLRQLGANVLRVYTVPPGWLLDLAAEKGLRLLVEAPWDHEHCFLDHEASRAAARTAVRTAAARCAGHPAVFAISVANEIPPDIVRWSGAAAVEAFLDRLVLEVKEVDPDRLCTFGNFPPTEYLRPREPDFVCFNVYLHQRRAFRNYLARLQMLADTKPLVLGEFGMDALREGEVAQADLLEWTIELAFRGGAAGTIAFAFTDEWFRTHSCNRGRLITDWQFGLTTADRRPRPAWRAVQRAYARAPRFAVARTPRVSVVVAAFNAGRTIERCLESLAHLNYPDYEVLVVDDGSTDVTPQIAASFSHVRVLRHPQNLGLSTARNTGIAAASGEVVAFTDADCRADEDWLHHTVADLLEGAYAGVGGHNLLPPEDSRVPTAVMASPGGPAHVMLTDRIAEHLPGCNLVLWKWALEEIGGFDPVFRQAGDDVDVCWRLQQRGHQLGFSPGGFVWHYRRSTVREYLKQQRGYGAAEALLERKHPEHFNRFGGSIWRGRIYAQASAGLRLGRPMIYHGAFGVGFFQSLYSRVSWLPLTLLTSIEYYALVCLPLLVLATMAPQFASWWLASAAAPAVVCALAASEVVISRRRRAWWSRPLVALLFLLQPLVRGWARYQGRLARRDLPLENFENLDSLSRQTSGDLPPVQSYRLPSGFDRTQFLARLLTCLAQQRWPHRPDTGWSKFDLEVYGSRWCKLRLTTATERAVTGGWAIRCRLRGAWTLATRIGISALLGVALAAIGLSPAGRLWQWFLLIIPPLAVLLVRRRQRDLRRVFGSFLDQFAAAHGLQRLDESGKTVPLTVEPISPSASAPSPPPPALGDGPRLS